MSPAGAAPAAAEPDSRLAAEPDSRLAAEPFTHGAKSRKPESTKKIGTPISAREYTNPS
jgi:hypothetical protein